MKKVLPFTGDTGDVERLSTLMSIVSDHPTPADFVKHLIHVPIFTPAPKAAALAAVNSEAEMVQLASYGLTRPHSFTEKQSVWQTIPPFVDFVEGLPVRRSVEQMRQAVRQAGLHITPEPWVESVLILPIVNTAAAPVGAMIFLFEQNLNTPITPIVSFKDFHSVLKILLKTDNFQPAESGRIILTQKETQCLQLAAQGHTNSVIAKKLNISVSNVKTTLTECYSKLEVKNRKNAVSEAVKMGLI